jgi:hypothetical protein
MPRAFFKHNVSFLIKMRREMFFLEAIFDALRIANPSYLGWVIRPVGE